MTGLSGAQSGHTEPGSASRKRLTKFVVIIAVALVLIVAAVVVALSTSGDGADKSASPAGTPATQLKEAPQSGKLGSTKTGGGE